MGSQFLGLILLIAAVAAGVYLVNNYADLLNLRIEVPVTVRPVAIPTTGLGSQPAPIPVFNETLPSFTSGKALRITSVRQPNSFNPFLEVVLSSSLNRGETIDITGWTVKSNKGSFRIPQAQEVYSFGGAIGDINLRYGDRLYFYSGFGPKGNFRLNKCLGYVEESSPFTPSLPKNCPVISRSEIAGFSGACQDYVRSLRTCEQPVANPPVPLDDSACHNFLNNLNYVGCVEKHKNDSDFLQNEWRAWLGGQINIFDPLHDKIQLFNGAGKVIDEYIY